MFIVIQENKWHFFAAEVNRLLFKSILIYALLFSLRCHCVSPDLAISVVSLHYPSGELSARLPVPLYFGTMLGVQYKDARKWRAELWIQLLTSFRDAGFQVNQARLFVQTHFRPERQTNVFQEHHRQSFFFCRWADSTWRRRCLTWAIACCKVGQICNYSAGKSSAMTVVVVETGGEIGCRNNHVSVFFVCGSIKCKGQKKTSGLPCDLHVQRRMFPDIIRRGKAIDFLPAVGMPADGIAYNHYGIKYVLKRLGDQRRSQGRTHTWRGGECVDR